MVSTTSLLYPSLSGSQPEARQQLDISPRFYAGIHVEHYPTKSVLLANLET